MNHVPMEISISGVYFSPVLMACLLGVVIAWIISRMLNWFDLARFVWYPPLFFLALVIICTGLVGWFIVPF